MRRSQLRRVERLERAASARQRPFYEAVVIPFGCDRATTERLIDEAKESARQRGLALIVSPEPAPSIEAWVESVRREASERDEEIER